MSIMTDNIIIVNNFFSSEEQQELELFLNKMKWTLGRSSKYIHEKSDKLFWGASLMFPECFNFFKNKIEAGLKQKIEIISIAANGQAHGQCGEWHIDYKETYNNFQHYFTLIYFPYEWPSEYGGHLLLKSKEIISILPEFNKAVIFNSFLSHIGLEPTIHCVTQRVSIACKFKLL